MLAGLVVGMAALIGAPTAHALPLAPEVPAPVTGVPEPCPSEHVWPGDDIPVDEVARQMGESFGFRIEGDWQDRDRDVVHIVWEALDAVSCTSYLPDLQSKVDGRVGLNATAISGYAWGDWSLTRPGYVSLDLGKFQGAIDSGDEGRLTRLVIHELAHTLNSDRYSEPGYWRRFKQLHAEQGQFSKYAGASPTETFADVVGYYVGRCAHNNPYDTGQYEAYYEFARDEVFGGKEFGPEPGVAPDCSTDGAESQPSEATPVWVGALGGE